jgi:hypothetical protein
VEDDEPDVGDFNDDLVRELEDTGACDDNVETRGVKLECKDECKVEDGCIVEDDFKVGVSRVDVVMVFDQDDEEVSVANRAGCEYASTVPLPPNRSNKFPEQGVSQEDALWVPEGVTSLQIQMLPDRCYQP